MQADIRPSDTVPTRFILFQNGSAVAENITTFHPNGCPIVVNIHLSPNGTCFIVEYLNERSIPYARKVFAASLGLGAEVEDSYVKRSASPKRSSYFRDSQPCPANISTLKSTLSDTGDGYQLSQQLEYHLTSAVTTDLRQPVMRLLAFRNLHAERPHMPADLLDEKQIMQTLLTNTEKIYARWPLPSAFTSSLAVATIDGSVTLTVSDHRQTFTVRFPALVHDPDGIVACLKKSSKWYKYAYIWIEQVFSARCPPDCWKYALALALGEYSDDTTTPWETLHVVTKTADYVTVRLPASQAQRVLIADNAFLHEASSVKGICMESRAISILWTDISLYRILRGPRARDVEVEAVIHSDGTVMRISEDLKFISVYMSKAECKSADGEVYVLQAVPESIRNRATGMSYPLWDISRDIIRLYQHANSCHRESLNSCKRAAIRRPVTAHATQTIPKIGTFTAFSDGTLRALFCDTTTVQSDGEVAKVTDKQGDTFMVRCQNPIGCDQYIRPLMKFARSVWDREGLEMSKKIRAQVSQTAIDCLRKSSAFLRRDGKHANQPLNYFTSGVNVESVLARNKMYVRNK